MIYNNQHSCSPISMILGIHKSKNLIYQLTKREIGARYRGSLMGATWSILNPLLLLMIYSVVFTYVFRARWGEVVSDTQTSYSIILFIGLIIHGLTAEILNKSPALIIRNANYVKKVVFPLEILAISEVFAALFHYFISFSVLLVILIGYTGGIKFTVVLMPITALSIVPMMIGASWFLSSLGTYLRDLNQLVGLVVTALLFLSPVFYPVSGLPQKLQNIILWNPITIPIEETRKVVLYGQYPDWNKVLLFWMVSIVFLWMGYCVFQKSRKGFSDVL